MKPFLLALFLIFGSTSLAIGQEDPIGQKDPIGQNFLFDESDIIIQSGEAGNEETVNATNSEIELNNAVNQAKDLLNKKPISLPKIEIPEFKKSKNI